MEQSVAKTYKIIPFIFYRTSFTYKQVSRPYASFWVLIDTVGQDYKIVQFIFYRSGFPYN